VKPSALLAKERLWLDMFEVSGQGRVAAAGLLQLSKPPPLHQHLDVQGTTYAKSNTSSNVSWNREMQFQYSQ
jgi:hypothetical protein